MTGIETAIVWGGLASLGLAILCGIARSNAKAAAIADAAYQRQLDATALWIYEHRIRGVPPKMICSSVPAGFDDDERALCVLPGVDLLELRAVRRSVRHGRVLRRPNHRLARGLSIRLGASASTGVSESESFDELRQIDQGTLILTTKRLAFLGSLRTNSSSLDDLIGVNDIGNGIQVHRERKQKAETYVLTSPLIVDGLEITGSMIQLAIEMAKLAQEVDALEVAPPPPDRMEKVAILLRRQPAKKRFSVRVSAMFINGWRL